MSKLDEMSQKKRTWLFAGLASVVVVIVVIFAIVIPNLAPDEVTEAPGGTSDSKPITGTGTDDDKDDKDSPGEEGTEAPLENKDVPPNPTSADEEVSRAQQAIIDELNRQAEAQYENPDHWHGEIGEGVENAGEFVRVAREGALQYCLQHPGETKSQKQERMAPYFEPDSSYYTSPMDIYERRTCSVEANTDPFTSSETEITVYVGVAQGMQLDVTQSASQGYVQYTVVMNASTGLIKTIRA